VKITVNPNFIEPNLKNNITGSAQSCQYCSFAMTFWCGFIGDKMASSANSFHEL
jgi:hypothetical protein